MTLTWAISNDIGGSSGDAGDIRGLTPFGAEVIKEMNRLGIVVDISHVSDPTFWDVIRATSKPVLASHSSARALANIPRNMTDAMLKAVAANGGAVCVNFGSGFLDDAFHGKEEALWAKTRSGTPLECGGRSASTRPRCRRQVPLARLLDHIQHVAKVAGVDHACLGSDFDGVPVDPRRAWKTRASCPRSPPACARAASRLPTSRRSWAATCCACSRRTSSGASRSAVE